MPPAPRIQAAGGAYIRSFRRVFDEGGVRSVLDCACGTGHDLVLFEKLGFEVVGSDISGAMLGRVRKNLTGLGFEIPW